MSSPAHSTGLLLARRGEGGCFAAETSGNMADRSTTAQRAARTAVALLSSILPLIPRQVEMLHWMAEARANDEVTGILACRSKTVKTHSRIVGALRPIGNPAISYCDSTNGDLKFVRINPPSNFTINWIALPP